MFDSLVAHEERRIKGYGTTATRRMRAASAWRGLMITLYVSSTTTDRTVNTADIAFPDGPDCARESRVPYANMPCSMPTRSSSTASAPDSVTSACIGVRSPNAGVDSTAVRYSLYYTKYMAYVIVM
jgi:hypothetical protein